MENADSFLKKAASFHGHLGPHLVLGLKMGLLAKNLLQGDPFNMRAEIHTQKTPPQSCILDGVQFSSGCTLGKGNIKVKEDSEIYGIFFKDSQKIMIKAHPQIIKNIKKVPRENLEEHAYNLFAMKDCELFDVVS